MDQNTQQTTESRDDLGNTPPKWKKGGYEDDSSHDAVFGEISSEGPDYRSVSTTPPIIIELDELTVSEGRIGRYCWIDDEDTNRPRCALYPSNI